MAWRLWRVETAIVPAAVTGSPPGRDGRVGHTPRFPMAPAPSESNSLPAGLGPRTESEVVWDLDLPERARSPVGPTHGNAEGMRIRAGAIDSYAKTLVLSSLRSWAESAMAKKAASEDG